MNNLLSYCGLVDVRINASDKDLPVSKPVSFIFFEILRQDLLQTRINILIF